MEVQAVRSPETGLRANSVHIWQVSLAVAEQTAAQLESLLSDDEQVRARRFSTTRLWRKYVVARAGLRRVLSHYIAIPPCSIQFTYNRFGKPFLAQRMDAILQFSIAHSGNLAVFAVAQQPIGVDVELIRADIDCRGIAARYFSAREQADLAAAPDECLVNSFYACWTRKEAYVKARGLGLLIPLDEFDVSCLPDQPAQLLAIRSPADAAARWSMHDLQLEEGYRGAVVVEGDSQLSYYHCH